MKSTIKGPMTHNARAGFLLWPMLIIGVVLMLASPARANTYLVTSTADSGSGSLRAAIISANTNPGPDTIDFSGIVLPTATSPVTIVLASGLPLITGTVVMDASITETRTLPDSPTRRPGVELDLESAAPVYGPSLAYHPDGFCLSGPGASNSVIRGFIINGLDGSTHSSCLLADSNPDPASSAGNPFPRQGFCGVPISVFAANGVVVAGNYLNLDQDGVTKNGTAIAAVEIVDGSDNVIGGETANDRNVLTADNWKSNDVHFAQAAAMIRVWSIGWSSPAFGAPKKTNNNKFEGNFIGVTAEGVSLPSFQRGIWWGMSNIEDDSVIGSGQFGWGVQCNQQETDPCEMKGTIVDGNLISTGNESLGIFGPIKDTVVNGNTLFMKAPVGPDGLSSVPYGRIEVFKLRDGDFPGWTTAPGVPVGLVISNNRLGIDSAGVPSGNTPDGILIGNGRNVVIKNNTITGAVGPGVDVGSPFYPPAPQNVTVTRNSIYGNALINGLLGIDTFVGLDLNVDGLTLNDSKDTDEGPNGLQNFPVLNWAHDWAGIVLRVHGHLNSEPNQAYRIELFANDVVNASGYGEGKRYLGSVDVTTNGGGNAVFDTSLSLGALVGGDLVKVGDFVTSTATKLCTPDPDQCPSGTGPTSEFSRAIVVTVPD